MCLLTIPSVCWQQLEYYWCDLVEWNHTCKHQPVAILIPWVHGKILCLEQGKTFFKADKKTLWTKFRPRWSSCSGEASCCGVADDITSSPTVTYTRMGSSAKWGESLPTVRTATLKPRHWVVPKLLDTASDGLSCDGHAHVSDYSKNRRREGVWGVCRPWTES